MKPPRKASPRAAPMPSEDPLHQNVGGRGAWTRVNVAEALPGVPTPLNWTFWFPVMELGMLGAWREIGVLSRSEVRIESRAEERLMAIFHGRPSVNVDRLRQMSDRIPGTSGDAVEAQFLGNLRPGVTSRPTRARYPQIAARLPLSLLRLRGRLTALRREIHPWWQSSVGSRASLDQDLARSLLREAQARFLRVFRPHAVAGVVAQGLYEQLRRLAAAAGRGGLESGLASGYGNVEETSELEALWAVARGRKPLEEFLAQFGFHAPAEGELSSRSWREVSDPLRPVLEQLRSRAEDESPSAMQRRQAARRVDAERELMQGLAARSRFGARAILGLARYYFPLRESGKATFLRVLDVARYASRRLGAHLFDAGVLDDPQDVFYLTFAELVEELPHDVSDLVTRRRAKREEYLALELPDSWMGKPEPRRIDVEDGRGTLDGVIAALGVSPGIVEGRVRLVTDPARDACPEPGEILVCPMTDPSWAAHLMLASAAVIDMGGPISHGATIARELGIPCVINARTASRTLRTGDRVRVNGASGRVELLERG